MSTSGWQQVFEIFEEAAELPPGERPAFLDRACGDASTRRAVEELLAADAEEESVVDRPLVARPAASEAPRDVAGPRTVGSYRLLRQVGQGGMSTVYLAVRADDAFRRHVVVKLVRPGMESEAILRRLRVERQILASLDHPYVARLYDGGSTDDGLPYFVMEYVDGLPIDAWCEHNELDLDGRLKLFCKVCQAVRYAHQNLVVHRDIKPSNILVTQSGDPKLLDFGIAKLMNPELVSAEIEPTVTWQRVMTPSYASPEQVRGQPITTTSDVYSLGVLLYKLLTGRLPRSFKGRSPREIEQLLADTEPPPPSTVGADPEYVKVPRHQLHGDLDAIVLKALRSAPAQRYGSVEKLVEDVERYQDGLPVTARTGTWRYRVGKLVRRHRTAVAVTAAVAVLLVAFAAAMAWQSLRLAHERDQARLERDEKQAVLALILDVFRTSSPYVLPGEELTVRAALERSVPVLESGLDDQPEVRAELLYASGSILMVLGDYRAAEAQLEEVLAIRRRLHGERHADVVATMSALAGAKKELDQLDEAEALARRAVALARELAGDDPAEVLSPLSELVSVLCYRGEYEAAAGPAQEALDLVRSLPEVTAQKILAFENLAVIKSSEGDYPAAAALYRQALAMRRQHEGEGHPAQINALANLGLVLRRQGELEAAERTYEEVLELEHKSFGEDYREPATYANLAGVRFARGDWTGAQELYHEALDAVLESSGPEDWRVFLFELGIEQARLRGGGAAAAEDRLRRLLELWRPRLGDDHSRILQAKSVLGEAVSVQGRCGEAEPLLVESYRLLLEGARHRHKLDAFERLSDHFERCGQRQEIAVWESMLTPEG